MPATTGGRPTSNTRRRNYHRPPTRRRHYAPTPVVHITEPRRRAIHHYAAHKRAAARHQGVSTFAPLQSRGTALGQMHRAAERRGRRAVRLERRLTHNAPALSYFDKLPRTPHVRIPRSYTRHMRPAAVHEMRHEARLAEGAEAGQRHALGRYHRDHKSFLDALAHVASSTPGALKDTAEGALKLTSLSTEGRVRAQSGMDLPKLGRNLYGMSTFSPSGRRQAAGIGAVRPHRVAIAAGTVAANVAEHPAKTARQFVHSLPGMIGGVGELITEPGHAGKAIKKDYAKRWGRYLTGQESHKKFEKRVDKDPLPYALDVFASGVPLGRGAQAIATLAEEGGVRGGSTIARALTHARPDLRVASGIARPQRLSHNLYGIAAQRATDLARHRYTKRMAQPGKVRPRRILAELAQEEGQVVGVLPGISKRRIVNARGTVEQVHRGRMMRERARTLTRANRKIRKLLPRGARENGAFWAALERGIRTPEQARAFAAAETERVLAARAQREMPGESFPHDTLKALEDIGKHADEYFGPQMKMAARLAKATGSRGRELDPFLHGNMRARIMEPVARELGVRPRQYLDLSMKDVMGSVQRHERRMTKRAANEAAQAARALSAEQERLSPASVAGGGGAASIRQLDEADLITEIEQAREAVRVFEETADASDPMGQVLLDRAQRSLRARELELERRQARARAGVERADLKLMRRPLENTRYFHGTKSGAPFDTGTGRPFHMGTRGQASMFTRHMHAPGNDRITGPAGDFYEVRLHRGAQRGHMDWEGLFDRDPDLEQTMHERWESGFGSVQHPSRAMVLEDSMANDLQDLANTRAGRSYHGFEDGTLAGTTRTGPQAAEDALAQLDNKLRTEYTTLEPGVEADWFIKERRRLWEDYKRGKLDVFEYENAFESGNLSKITGRDKREGTSAVVLNPNVVRAGRPGDLRTEVPPNARLRAEAISGMNRYAPENPHSYRGRIAGRLREEGRAMPGYFRHETEPYTGQAEHTLGHGQFAPGRHPSTQYRAFETGRHSVSQEAWAGGVARNLKRKYAQDFIQNMIRDFTPPFLKGAHWEAGPELADGLTYGGRGLTWQQARFVRRRAAVNDQEYVLVNMHEVQRRFQSLDNPLEMHESFLSNLADVLNDPNVKLTPSAVDSVVGQPGGRWYFMDRAAYEDMVHAVNAKAHLFGRVIRKYFKGLPSAFILNSNPSWLALQVLNNQALLALNGISPTEMYAAFRDMQKLKKAYPEEYDYLMSRAGAGSLAIEMESLGTRLGGAEAHRMYRGLPDPVQRPIGAFEDFYRRWKDSAWAPGGRVINLSALFKGDVANNWIARAMAARNQVQVQKMRGLSRAYDQEIGALDRAMAQFQRLTPADYARMIRDPRAFEDVGRAMDDLLGNYSRFTPTERRYLEANIMFYGFLRFSLRFTLYTLPLKHPIAHSIMNRLSALHEDEVRRLLHVGPHDPLPGYFLGNLYKVKDGRLTQLPLSRLNPMMNQLTQATGAHPAQVLSVLSPLWVEGIGQLTGFNVFTGKGYHLRENPRTPVGMFGLADPRFRHMSLEERGRIALRHGLEWSAPYRAWEDAAQRGRPITEESLAWDMRPFRYIDPDTQANINRNRRRMSSEYGKEAERTLGDPVYSMLSGDWAPSNARGIARYLKEEELRARGIKRRRPGGGSYLGGGGSGSAVLGR